MINSVNADQEKQQFKTGDADSYNTVVEHFDRYTQRFTAHLADPLLALAKIPQNGKVLDLGTGTGVVALAAAKMYPQGRVVGIDLSDGMLSTAREKASQEGLQEQTEFLKMDAEGLEFSDHSFDAAVSLYALQHFPEPSRALSEIYRVLKPGASVVVAVGSPPSLFSIHGVKAAARRLGSIWRRLNGRELSACGYIDSLVEKHIPQKADREVTEWAGNLHGSNDTVKNMVGAAGFTGIRCGWKGQYSIIETADDFWLLQMTFSSTARKRIQQADDRLLKNLKAEFYEGCDQVLKKNGRLVYQTGAEIVTGIKPAE